MTAGGEGYVLEVPYTWGFFKYQSPVLLNHVARRAGRAAPDLDAPFTYCDLGCGNGLTILMLASAFPQAQFWGVDFNPDHIDEARKLARNAGLTNITFVEGTFAQAAASGLPPFDYITLHGVYSWVDGAARAEIHDFVAQCAAPSCILYLCYNAFPGATKLLPIWKIMQSHARGSGRPVTETVPEGLEILRQVAHLDGRFFRDNAGARQRLSDIEKRNLSYLVHEFGNGAFAPQFFTDTNAEFGALGFRFGGSAELDRANPNSFVDPKFASVVNGIDDPDERESVISFIRNESFRWDVFLRGPARDNDPHILPNDGLIYGVSHKATRLTGEFRLGRRKISLDGPLPAALIAGFGPTGATLNEARRADRALKTAAPAEIRHVLDDLLGLGILAPRQGRNRPANADPNTGYRLALPINRAHLHHRLEPDGRVYVMSPVTGTALRLTRVDASCLLLLDNDAPRPAHRLFDMLEPYKNSDTVRRKLRGEELTVHWAKSAYADFLDRRLNQFLALGILEPR